MSIRAGYKGTVEGRSLIQLRNNVRLKHCSIDSERSYEKFAKRPEAAKLKTAHY